MHTEKVKFKVSSALKNLIGQELITNNHVAVFELVKNSFDAKSKNIDVVFNLKDNTITISDDGTGMSRDEIVNKWLFIGYSDKKNDSSASFSGNKGIGRFSCDRLGQKMELVTIKDNVETKVKINWKDFERDQIDEIQSIFLDLESSPCNKPSGTTIIISDLNDEWSENEIDHTKKQLLRLISPNVYDISQNLNLKIVSRLGIETSFNKLENDVFKYMEDKTIFVRASFNKQNIVVELFDHGRIIVHNISKNLTPIDNATMQVFFNDRGAKTIFKKRTGMDIVNYGNIFIYRNKFRVFPYGEIGFDIFGLAQRKTQGYNRYLGPREIIGWIDLVDNSNHFIESTSRDRGFIENIFYDSLRDSYFEYIHRPLEKYVQLINYGNVLVDDLLLSANDAVINEIVDAFKTKTTEKIYVDEQVLRSLSNDKKLENLDNEGVVTASERRRIIKETKDRLIRQEKSLQEALSAKKQAEIENKSLKNEIETKNRYFEVERPIRQEVLEHDLGLVSKRLSNSLDRMVKENLTINNEIFNEELKSIAWTLYRIQGIRNFALKTKMDTKRNHPINVGAFFEEYSKNLLDEDYDVVFKVVHEFCITINVFDLISIFDNIFSNAKVLSASKITVCVDSDYIDFYTDTYSENANIDFSRAFDFGYSTTGGTGMGMYIIKQICIENNLSVSIGRFDQTNLVRMRIQHEKDN